MISTEDSIKAFRGEVRAKIKKIVQDAIPLHPGNPQTEEIADKVTEYIFDDLI
jgi:hypothetical protein